MFDRKTKLCMASALNGVGFEPEEFDDVKPLVLASVEDWFLYNPSECLAFADNKQQVLRQLRTSSQPEVKEVLVDMGFREDGGLFVLDGDQWKQFIKDTFTEELGRPPNKSDWKEIGF